MRINELYKHERMRNIAFYPVKIFTIPLTGTVKVKGYWFNVHYNELAVRDPFLLIETPEKLELTKEQVKQFKLYIPNAHWGELNHVKIQPK